MKSSIFLYSISLSILHANVARAYWRMACGVSQTSRTDPVLSPGTVSGHVHKFAGGNNVNPSSTQDSLLTSTCSSCQIQEDKSAYWTPQLYYAHSNGTFEEVQNDGMTVYYVGRGGDASNTVAFPPGFQMISGNSLQRSYDSQTLTHENTRPVADRVSFRCINEANDIPEEHYMFNTNCVNGMRAQINFQSCWDGQNLYLPNSEHVAYLSGIDYGTCPPTHPIPIPGLFYEVLYWTNRIDQSAGGRFVFSNGDATGYGFHGDFLNGWNQDVQTAAVQDCLYTDNGGVISACPVLQASDDVDVSRNCPESASVWDEPVHGSLSSLPGCNPITNGPGLAPQVICPLNNNSPTQSEAASLATTMATISASSQVFPGFVPTTTATDAAPTTNFFNSNAVTTVTTTIGLPPAQQTPGIFANNSTANSTSTLTSTATDTTFPTITPILSFTTMFVASSTSNPDASILASTTDFTSTASTPTTSFITDFSGVCSFFSQFSIEGCATVTAAATTTSISISATDAMAMASTSTSPFDPQVTTTLVTQTQPITQELTSTFTTFVASSPTATVQSFRFRRRQQQQKHQQQKQQQQKRQDTPDETDTDADVNTNANANVNVNVNANTNLQADDLSRLISEVIAQTNAGSDDDGDETTDTSPQEKEQDDDDDASDATADDSGDDSGNEDDSADDTADDTGDDSSDTADEGGFSDGDDTYHGSGMGCMLWGRCG